VAGVTAPANALLARAHERGGFTQAQLGQLLGVSRQSVTFYIQDRHRWRPSDEQLDALYTAVRTRQADLLALGEDLSAWEAV
jgi:transcriptional regulator with XRE-family HTH domain